MLVNETSLKAHVENHNPEHQTIVGETVALLPNWPTEYSLRIGNPFSGIEDGFPYLRTLDISYANGMVKEGLRLGIAEGSPEDRDSNINSIEQRDIIFSRRRPVVARTFQDTVNRLIEAATMKPGLEVVQAEQDKHTPTARTKIQTITPGHYDDGGLI